MPIPAYEGKVTKLYTLGRHWYAKYVEGNSSYESATEFPVTMTKEQVLAEIKRRTPNIEICLEK